MKIIIFGPPGSGKSTIARELSKYFKLKYVSSDILRREVKSNSRLGKIIKIYMEGGELIPSNIMDSIIKINLPKNNFILDGYPRTLKEAKFLSNLNKPDKVVVLYIGFHTAKSRLLKRAKIEGRSDDTPELIAHRFKIYKKQTLPVLKCYKDKIIKVNANKKPEEVKKYIVKIFENANRSSKAKP